MLYVTETRSPSEANHLKLIAVRNIFRQTKLQMDSVFVEYLIL